MKKITNNDARIVAEEALNRLGFYDEEMVLQREPLKEFFAEWITNYDISLNRRETLGILKGVVGTLGVITLVKCMKNDKEEE